MFFHIVEDSVVILRCGGIYTQTSAYTRNGFVYAKKGAGFVKLLKHQQGTSHPSTSWDSIDVPFKITYNSLGAMEAPKQ